VRCSLLTLSTYLDNELAPERAGEVEAHLVACQRCSSGLGYLREEQAHIRALAAVIAAPGAAEDLLDTVGLSMLPAPSTPALPKPPQPAPQFLLDLAESPKPAPTAPPGGNGSYLELNGSTTVKDAPVAPASEPPAREPAEPEAAVERFGPETFERPASRPEAVEPPTPEPDQQVEPAPLQPEPLAATETGTAEDPVEEVHKPATPAPPRWSQPYARVERATEVQPSLDPSVRRTEESKPLAPETPAVPAVPNTPGGRPASWLDRARDAVALRWALMRGSSTNDVDEDDDNIQIVSGTGAPARRGGRSDRPAADVRPAATPSATTPASPEHVDAPSAPAPVEKPEISFAPPEHEPLRRPAFTAHERMAARAAVEKLKAEGVLSEDSTSASEVDSEPVRRAHSITFDMQDSVAPPAEVPRPQRQTDEPGQPGRHQRALNRDGARFKVPSFSASRPKRPAASRPSGVDGPFKDRRLWIFGSVVLVLLLIGLLVGKSVTPASNHIAPGTVPNPTAIAQPTAQANSTPTPAATPQPTPQATPQPTATPAPTPAGPNPSQLTGAQNLGAGGTGFAVQDIRYGAHPGDFRIVFDLSGNGSPSTTVGFGAPTTLYVEFTGTTGPASVAQPASGNVATAVKLLQPSPVADKTIYEITLSGPAKLSTMYLQSPLRLVIDLS
jgi:hypothetical protein